jgi:protein AbiQ
MKWYTVEEYFLNYLRNNEKRIPKTDYSKRFKPFFGSLFEIGNLVYLTQVSHPKTRHISMKQSPDFIKLYDENTLIAVVNLNYMFPVCKKTLIHVEYKKIENFREFYNDIQKNNYIYLLKKEMKQIKKINIKNKAIKLYKRKYDFPENKISKRCFDFKYLEQKCAEYKF